MNNKATFNNLVTKELESDDSNECNQSESNALANVQWYKQRDEHTNWMIHKVSDNKFFSEDEKKEFENFLTEITKDDQPHHLIDVIEKCTQLSDLDFHLYAENYDNLLHDHFLDCMIQHRGKCVELYLSSGLIDIHRENSKAVGNNYVIVASFCAQPQTLKNLIKKGANFEHKCDSKNNILHVIGLNAIDEKSSVECVNFLFNDCEVFKQHLEESNYQMLFDQNVDSFTPFIQYLKNSQFETFEAIINSIDKIDIMTQLKTQINTYANRNYLPQKTREVIQKFNEKTNALIEKNQLSERIMSVHCDNTKKATHKI